jgi:predicted Zn-dependent peptidase
LLYYEYIKLIIVVLSYYVFLIYIVHYIFTISFLQFISINGIKLIEEGKLTSISASCLSYLHSGLFFIEIVGEGKYMKKIMTTVAQALKEVREKGLTASEVARAQKLLKREALNCFSANLLLDDIGQQLLFKGKYNPVHEILKRIDSISLQDVSAAAKKLANPSMVAYGVVDTVPYLDQLEL